ncbi:MAG TPA: hypothetical protein VF755_28295 [Catenuloplanes sp.]|jgi:hypothetical protein
MSTSQEQYGVPGRTGYPDGQGGPPGEQPTTRAPGDSDGGAHVPAVDRHTVVRREKEQYGGIKWGSAFFGWLTATGTAVILTALLAAAGTAVGVASGTSAGQAADEAARQAPTVGVAGGIALLVVLLLAYYCGGYVAGRMARFSGAKQGIAVWVWAIAIAVVVAVVGALLGSEFDVLARLDGFPRIPINEGDVTTGGIIAILAAAAAALIGAILGGLAGMRFHRKVDKAGLGH